MKEMSSEERQRIEEAARVYADRYNINQYYYEGIFDGYIDGAKAEHSRMAELLKEERNKAIQECITAMLNDQDILFNGSGILEKLESLKR